MTDVLPSRNRESTVLEAREAGMIYATARDSVVEALRPSSLSIHRGEFVALVGPSGCGKSTLLNMFAGLIRPTSGEVAQDGRVIDGPNTNIGYMTQADTLLPWRNVTRNIELPMLLKGRKGPEVQRRIEQLIETVQLTGFETSYPRELSGGMRKRLSLAQTLANDPDVILLDEPFGALDAMLKVVLQTELLRIVDQGSKTIVLVTHDIDEAIALADRIVVMSRRPGRIKDIIDVPIERPRDPIGVRKDSRYAGLEQRVWENLRDEVTEAIR